MMKFIDKIANLIDVKTIVTFVIIAVFATLAISGKITPENVMVVTTTIITFFFAKKDSDQTKGK